MRYRELGRTGLKVSEISLGCWAIGGPSWRDGEPVGWSGNNDEESMTGLRKAIELGINHLDTADVYGDGHSERLIGKLLKEVPRDRLIVGSKVGWFKGTAPHAMHPLQIRHQLEQTLSNLGTDYVDIYYFHNADFGPNDCYLEEAAELLRQFKQEGKILHIGQSAYNYADMMRVAPVTQPDVLQFSYSALGSEYDQEESNLFRWADERNIGMVLFQPYQQGLMLDKFDPDNPPQFGEGDIRATTGRFTREKLLEVREKLKPVKERFGSDTQSLVGVASQFALAQSKHACVIPGFKNARQVESNAKASEMTLTAEDVAFIRKAMQG